MEPLLVKDIFYSYPWVVFSAGTYTASTSMDLSKRNMAWSLPELIKPYLRKNLLEILQCHWATDANVFPEERQRFQLVTILL